MYITGIKLNHVPYKGSGPAQQDLMSGIIKVSFVGTPREIVAKLNGEIGKLMGTDEVKKLLAPTGMEPDPDTPAQFGAYLKADYDKWGKVVRDSGATVQ
ncbi:MAG: hypothetical protein E6H59_11405 [Betaproteobacteria bacterium]|nr:MAG: hypothetical protein E6H59_11405 [Betaproteobacteria bacterium]